MSSPPPGGLRFPKEARLRRRAEFLKVQQTGQSLSAGCLSLVVLRNEGADTRLGLTVSTKVGNAVVRNRIRRQLREQYRHTRADFPRGLDLVIIARPRAKDADRDELARSFGRLLADVKRRFG